MRLLEPSHNVTVYRCKICNDAIAEVPAGFTILAEDLEDRAHAHGLLKHTVLELHLADSMNA